LFVENVIKGFLLLLIYIRQGTSVLEVRVPKLASEAVDGGPSGRLLEIFLARKGSIPMRA